MADEQVAVWPRPYFKQVEQPTKLLFVCFGKAPLAEVPLTLAGFGLPNAALARQVRLGEHRRESKRAWFENWWGGAFGVIAATDLGDDLTLLTTSDVCFTLSLELPDHPDLAPLQSVWGLSRWLCARGVDVVLDVHAFRFRSRGDVEALDFSASDVQRDVKFVLESEPSEDGAHLMHTRGLCKFGRPELLCFIQPEDGALMGRVLSQLARTLMDGFLSSQLRLRIADGVELVTKPFPDAKLVESLGLEGAVLLVRSDGAPLVGLTRLAPER